MQKFLDTVSENIPAVQHEFNEYQKAYFPERSPQFFCLELNGEAGELANLEKKIWKGRDINEDMLEDEAADVFIALMNYANSRRINLGKAVARKLKGIDKNMKEMKKAGKEY